MKKIGAEKFLYYALILSVTSIVGSCGLLGIGGKGNRETGELIEQSKVEKQYRYAQTIPYGMVPIPAGTFHMGQADEDPASTQMNFNKQITIGGFFMDDTEITNDEYNFFMNKLKVGLTGPDQATSKELLDFYAEVNTKYPNKAFNTLFIYPDTTVWRKDFTHHMSDPLVANYWSYPGYQEYPVVGISWEAAVFFGKWRTHFLNSWREDENVKDKKSFSTGLPKSPMFRLPSEAEWEYAARGGRDMNKYPWGNPYIRNSKGCMLANFKPGRGNYFDDGFAYTSPVQAYFPNDYGLFDMSGNAAEWCLDDFNPASVPTVWDLNPQFIDKNAYDKDGNSKEKYNARKVVRGGSWKDIAYFLETGTRTYEYKDSTRAYIGFRCAMTSLGRSSGAEFQ